MLIVMDGIHRQLLADPAAGDVVGPFFGFMGAAAALVFACEFAQCSEIVQVLLMSLCQHQLLPVASYADADTS